MRGTFQSSIPLLEASRIAQQSETDNAEAHAYGIYKIPYREKPPYMEWQFTSGYNIPNRGHSPLSLSCDCFVTLRELRVIKDKALGKRPFHISCTHLPLAGLLQANATAKVINIIGKTKEI